MKPYAVIATSVLLMNGKAIKLNGKAARLLN